MKRTPARIAVASAMTAAIALGTVSAADAHSRHERSHSKHHKASKKKGYEAKARAAEKQLAYVKAKVAREAAKKVVALSRVEYHVAKANLGAEYTAAVKANIAADKAAVEALGKRVGYANNLSDAYKAGSLVASYRVENYEQVKAILAFDNRVDAKITGVNKAVGEVAAAADAKAAQGGDVTKVREHLDAAKADVDAAGVAVDASVAKALTVHANTPKRSFDSALHQAKVEAYKAAVAIEGAEDHVEDAEEALDEVVVPAPTTSAFRR